LNLTDGHNVPTGFSGERAVWLHVTVTDSTGDVIFESGDVDPNGDYRDDHSAYVANGELPLDHQLFSLQSKFVVSNVRGSERERVVPVPYPLVALVRVLPAPLPLIATGEPPTERNHRMGIEPLGYRWAKYKIKGKQLTGRGPYKVSIKLYIQMVPVNLVNAISAVGFDFGMSVREVADTVVAGKELLWEKDMVLSVTGT